MGGKEHGPQMQDGNPLSFAQIENLRGRQRLSQKKEGKQRTIKLMVAGKGLPTDELQDPEPSHDDSGEEY